jgi:hypothetical protein
MDTNRKIRPSDVPDGEIVSFGPIDDRTGKQLAIPRTFSRIVENSALGFQLQLWCEFSGDRIEVKKLTIDAGDGEIASRKLLQLGLPAIVRQIAFEVVPGAAFWTFEGQERNLDWDAMNTHHEFLAQLYWFEHISWGSPRQEIMRYFGMKRTAANALIRKVARHITLPGSHDKSENS